LPGDTYIDQQHYVALVPANARLEYVEQQLSRAADLARDDFASQQTLDQAQKDVTSACADVAEAQANHAAAKGRPTREERAIANPR
jgi:HlyD family secretion protein